jgi:two-component system LytT family response regulator
MTLRAVIVDDEPLARDLLDALLAEHEDIQVVAKCQNGREAISYLQSTAADLLFLDVQMPNIDGFDVLEKVGLQHLPPTVFVTAYQEHAVRAFDVHAVDYLTKPVDAERLTQEQFTAMLSGLRNSEEPRSYPSRFLVKDGEKEILLPVEKVDWVEAAQYYCCLHTNGRQYMLRETITELDNRLSPTQFVRIHRSSIVNLDRIREIYRDGHGEGSIVLTDGTKLRMSKVGRQKLADLGKA